MSSGVSGTPQHAFLSTHNALRMGGDDDDKLFIHISELGGGDRQTALSVYPFYDVEMVKRLVIKKLELPPSTNISELRIFYRGTELPNHRSLLACTTDRERGKIRLQWSFKDGTVSTGVRELGLRPPPQLEALISEINLALQRGMNPHLTMDGTGGTYLMTNTKRQNVAMFKPSDEEAFAPHNPRGYEGKLGQKGFRSGVLSGEGAQREVAAFLLDAQYGGVAGVPQTTKVEACHPSFSYRPKNGIVNNRSEGSDVPVWKDGSLQEFVDANECCGDFDARVFSVADAHKIGILDLRVLNLDRNDGNLLVGPAHHLKASSLNISSASTPDNGDLTPDGKVTKYRLIPIDHGLILPDTMDLGDIDLVWFYWPQSKIQFSEVELRYIFSLDPDKDALRLSRKLEIREECLRTMRVSTRVLQIGARMHLNLFQIATLVLRFNDFEIPSIMERAVKTSLMQAWTAVNACSLIQSNRLPGSVTIDLQIAEVPKDNEVRFASTSKHDHQKNGTPSKRVEFAMLAKETFEVREPTLDFKRPSKESEQNESTFHTRKASRYPSLQLSPEATSSSFLLPKLILSDESFSSWDSWSSSSFVSSHASSDESEEEYPVLSRITGIPLTGCTPILDSQRKKRKEKGQKRHSKNEKNSTSELPLPLIDNCCNNFHHAPQSTSTISGDTVSNQSPIKASFPLLAKFSNTFTSAEPKAKKHAAFNSDADLVASRTTTVRKRTTALSRRGTSARVTPNMNCTWSLIDSNKKPVPLDWENPLLEKTFFECFEVLIRRHILETHPNWESYPFNGDSVIKEFESAAAQHRHRRRSTTKRFDSTASSSWSNIYSNTGNASSNSTTGNHHRGHSSDNHSNAQQYSPRLGTDLQNTYFRKNELGR